MAMLNQSFSKKNLASFVRLIIFFVLFWAFGHWLNLPIRNFLKSFFPEVPYWVDHIFFMITAKMIFALLIGFLFLKPSQRNLNISVQSKYWLEAMAVGCLLVVLLGFSLHFMGLLHLQFKPQPLLMLGNFFSNFYEEFIYRSVLLGLFLKYSKNNQWLAMILSSTVFLSGHLYYPPILIILVFIAGVYWAGLTIRSQSILPGWLSHCTLDFIADSIFMS